MEEGGGVRVGRWVGAALALPVALFMLVCFVVPLLDIARASVLTYVPRGNPSEPYTIANYVSFLTDPYYERIFLSTVVIALSTTVSSLVIGFPLAYWIVRGSRVQRALGLAAVLVPLLVSDVVRAYGWTILLVDNGFLAQAVTSIGLPFPSLLRTPTAVTIGLTEVLLPFVVLPTVGSLAMVPSALEEASRSLGAGTVSTLARVDLPLAAPGLVVGGSLVFLLSVGAFVTPSLMGGPIVPVMGTLVYDQAMDVDNWPMASAIGLILLAFVLLVLGAIALAARLVRR